MVIVGVDAKWASDLDGEFGYVEVKKALVGSVGRFAGPKGGWEER